jgi:hypothetical protein
MKVSAKTPEGHAVISGVGTLCFTHGVPLEIVLGFFKDNDLVVDWFDYIRTALLDGHNPRTVRARIDSSTADIYGGAYAKEVVSRTDKVLALFA